MHSCDASEHLRCATLLRSAFDINLGEPLDKCLIRLTHKHESQSETLHYEVTKELVPRGAEVCETEGRDWIRAVPAKDSQRLFSPRQNSPMYRVRCSQNS